MNLRGWFGELKCAIAQRLFLDRNTYHCFNNLIVKTRRGTTQIDHVIMSRYGIFVVEAKYRSGWIFGDEHSRYWTQVLFRKKDQFPNPLHQNFGHMKALEEHLKVSIDKMCSVVVFWGNCEFKTPVPSNVLIGNYTGYIKSKTDIIFSDTKIKGICDALRTIKSSQRFFDGWRHTVSVRKRFASTIQCPKCGGTLLSRTARRGLDIGKGFLGCSNYPNCKYTRNW